MSKGNRATVQALRRELVAMRGRIDTMLAESGTETTYAGMTCQGCEHEDMVHTNWVGACIIKGCNCPGMDKDQPVTITISRELANNLAAGYFSSEAREVFIESLKETE